MMHIDFNMYSHKTQKKTMVSGHNLLMEYKGKSNDVQNISKNQVSDYIVGIWDKEHHKVKLVDVDYFYTMTQKSKHAKEYKPTADKIFEGSGYYEQKSELVNVFGTKKAKQKMLQLKNNIVDDPTGAGDPEHKYSDKQMNKVLKHDVQKLIDEEQKKEEESEEENLEDVLPRHDPETKIIDKVYYRLPIIPKEIGELLKYKELYSVIKEEKEISDQLYSSYERTTIHSMKYVVDRENKLPPSKSQNNYLMNLSKQLTIFLTFPFRSSAAPSQIQTKRMYFPDLLIKILQM